MVKKQKGITLIALVITIIVLLILVGVSIATITGENGIVVKSKQAASKTEAAEKEEQEVLGNLDEYINSSTSSESTAKTLVQAFEDGEIAVGDYVAYRPSNESATVELKEIDTGIANIQTYSVDIGTTWRVLGLNEDGTELIITTGSPIKKDGNDPYLHLQGAESYYNCVDTLNKISSIYHNSSLATETRSMTMEDINNILGVVIEGNIVYKTSDTEKRNLDRWGVLGNSYTYKAGDYALENYLKEKYPYDEEIQKLETREIGDIVNATGYFYSYTNEDIVDSTSEIYDVLFSGTTEEEGLAKTYWLASPAVYADSTECSFGLCVVHDGAIGSGHIYYSNGNYFCNSLAVRPIVSLKSTVTIEQLVPITGSEVVWSTSAGCEGYGKSDKGQLVADGSGS